MTNAEKMFAWRCGAALLKYLEFLTPVEVARMRKNLKKRRMKIEESRDWKQFQPIKKHGVFRSRTGYFYR